MISATKHWKIFRQSVAKMKMKTANEWMHQIRWDDNIKSDEYIIYIYDRMTKKLKPIWFSRIGEIKKEWFVVHQSVGEVEIPMHRIYEIHNNNKIVWQRGQKGE